MLPLKERELGLLCHGPLQEVQQHLAQLLHHQPCSTPVFPNEIRPQNPPGSISCSIGVGVAHDVYHSHNRFTSGGAGLPRVLRVEESAISREGKRCRGTLCKVSIAEEGCNHCPIKLIQIRCRLPYLRRIEHAVPVRVSCGKDHKKRIPLFA